MATLIKSQLQSSADHSFDIRNFTQNNINNYYSEDKRGGESHYYVDGSSQANFIGRRDLLAALEAQLIPKNGDLDDPRRRIFVMHGIGGTGKTEIALKFAEESRTWFQTTVMLDARNTASLEQSSREIVGKAKLRYIGENEEKGSKTVADWLTNMGKGMDWLLIFDGANDPRIHLEKYFPAGGRGAILITTTSPTLSSLSTRSRTVSGLDSTSAAELLIDTALEDTSDHVIRSLAQEICERLDKLPLVILHAGSMIRNGHCTMSNFLDKVKIYQEEWLIAERDSKYSWVYGTWIACRDMIRERNTRESNDALDILTGCSLLDSKNIPLTIFERMPPRPQIKMVKLGLLSQILPGFGPSDKISSEALKWDDDRLRSAAVMLADYSLASFNRKSLQLSIHRSVHQWLSLDLRRNGGSKLHSWARSAMSFGLRSIIHPDRRSREEQAKRSALFRHVKAFIEQDTVPLDFSQPDDDNVARKFAFLYFDTGHYDLAEDWYRKCLSFYESYKKGNSEQYLATLVDLAETLERKSHFKEALEVCEKARRDPTSLAPTSKLAFKCRQIYALSLLGLGQSSAAKEELIGLLEQQNLGPQTINETTLETAAILANIFRREGDLAAAVERSEQVYKDRKTLLGRDHQDTLESARSLAITLLQQGGRLGDAVDLMKHVCESREKTLGPDHPDTILSLSTLAKLFKKQGNYVRAEEEQTKAWERLSKVLGPHHPSTLSMINSIGDLCLQKQRYQEAEALFRTAHEGYLANGNFGSSHSHTLVTQTNVAVSLQKQGRVDEASDLYEEVIMECRKNGRGRGPEALQCMMNQSTLHMLRQNFGAAELLSREVSAEADVLYGRESMQYFVALLLFSKAVQKQGRYSEAEVSLRTAREGLTGICGPENSTTLDAIALLAHVVSKQGRAQEAFHLYQGASNGFRKLGDDRHWCHKRLRELLQVQDVSRFRDTGNSEIA